METAVPVHFMGDSTQTNLNPSSYLDNTITSIRLHTTTTTTTTTATPQSET